MTEIPEALIARVHSAWPEVHADLVSLRAELTVITQKGFDGGRSLLGNDAANLVQSLEGICDFREAGVTNADVEAAEAETRTLIQDMRKRALGTIRDRSAMLRIHAETAALRADPDATPQDLTDSFRLLIAAPTSEKPRTSLIVEDIGLPEMGGQEGRVLGKVFGAGLKPDAAYVQGAAPLDTFYLPPGHQILLRKGEQVILRTQGMVVNKDIYLNDFTAEPQDTLIEAQENDVRICGPATLTTQAGPTLRDVWDTSLAMLESTKSMTRWQRLRTSAKSRTTFFCGAILASLGLAGLGFGVGVVAGNESGPGSFFLFFIGLFGAFLSTLACLDAERSAEEEAWKTSLPPSGSLPASTFHAVEQTLKGAGQVNASKANTCGYAMFNVIQRSVFSSASMQFYAVRRAVVQEDESIRVIRPVAALEAPKPETVIPFTQAKKATA